MATKAQQEKIEEVAVAELRRKYDEFCKDFDQLRLRVLAFITGELALATFLFSNGIPLPNLIYGTAFFGVGIIAIAASFIILLSCLRTTLWSRPIHRHYISEIDHDDFPDKVSFLKYVKESYIRAIDSNAPRVSTLNKRFDISLLLLVVGVIILLVIKYGGGTVQWHNIIRP